MTKRPRGSDEALAHEIERDAAAHRAATSQDLPALSDVARAVRNRTLESKEGFTMALMKRHPFLAPAAMTLGVLFLVMFLPVSFDRTVGHDVTMTLKGGALDAAGAGAIAKELKAQLGADGVQVNAEADGEGAIAFEFSAQVPASGGSNARAVTAAFQAMLETQGFEVASRVAPRIEKVSGTVAAYAADRVIRIETEGKSAAQIESELRAALEGAGLTGVQVSVTDEGGGKRRVEVNAERDAAAGTPEADEIPRIIVGDEDSHGANRVTVEIRKIRDDAGAITMQLTIGSDGREHEVSIPNPDSMSDGALEAEIESQLSAAGVSMDVTVNGGKISVETP